MDAPTAGRHAPTGVGEEVPIPARKSAASPEEGPGAEGPVHAGADVPSGGETPSGAAEGGPSEGATSVPRREDGRGRGLRYQDPQGVAQVPVTGLLAVNGPCEIIHGPLGAVVPVEVRRADPEEPATALPARSQGAGRRLATRHARPIGVEALIDVGRRGAAGSRAIMGLVGPRPQEEGATADPAVVPVNPGADPVRRPVPVASTGAVAVLVVETATDGLEVPVTAANTRAREEAGATRVAFRPSSGEATALDP